MFIAAVSFITPETALATCTNGIYNNGLHGLWIDINSTPYTTFATYSYGSVAYKKNGCAWYASARLNQLTGKGNTIWSGTSWYNGQGANLGFSTGTTLNRTYKALACYSNHVRVVEGIIDGQILISEGSYSYDPYYGSSGGTPYGYCRIEVISEYDLTHSDSDFLGYVYLNVPLIGADTTAPTVTGGNISNYSETGFDVSVTATDNVGVALIQIGVWHDNMSIDDAQWQTVNTNGSASFRVNVSDFGNALDTTYHVNAYARDAAGNTSTAYRVGDIVLQDPSKFFSIGIELSGSWSNRVLPGIYGTNREGDVIDLSNLMIELPSDLAVSYVFDHWESTNGGTFADAYEENTTFTMPGADTYVYKVYQGTNNLRLWILCTGYGGVEVSNDDGFVSIPNGGSRSFFTNVTSWWTLTATPKEGYRFSYWDTSDVDLTDTTESSIAFNMPEKNVTIQAVFEQDPYYPVNGSTMRLPDGLTTIESEAFAGVAARFFILPDSVTSVESGAFPQGSIVYLNTNMIQSCPVDAITGAGTYIETGYDSNEAFAEALQGTNYVLLSRDKTPVTVWGDWSDWSTDAVEADETTEVETITQYRSRSISSNTVYSAWSNWISNGATPINTTDLREVQTVAHAAQTKTVYTYDHYKYYNTSKSAWYYSYADTSSNSWSSQGKWEYAESDTPYTQYSWASSSGYDGWKDSSSTPWFHQSTTQVTVVAAYTEYQYRTRTVGQETTYGEWTDWSETPVAATDDLAMETRVLYRYRTKN